MTQTPKLTHREQIVLVAMADHLPQDYAAPFKNINTYVRNSYPDSGSACETWNIRRTVRALSRKGMTHLVRGLMSDDGYLMGSGYGVTNEGLKWFNSYLEALPPHRKTTQRSERVMNLGNIAANLLLYGMPPDPIDWEAKRIADEHRFRHIEMKSKEAAKK